jgi:hypothetical protein
MFDAWPMHDFFRVVRDVLTESVSVIHYRDATRMALDRLPPLPGLSMKRQIEDVREKMYKDGQFGLVYLGTPHCAAVFPKWLAPFTPELLPADQVTVAGNAEAGINAAYEAIMRKDNLIQKVPSASPEARFTAMARGYVIQHHVSAWFKRKWPQFWEAADNTGEWTRPCNHDFKLRVAGVVFLVDVAGERLRGGYVGPSTGKQPAHLHLCAKIHGDSVIIDGVMTGKDFAEAAGKLLPWYKAMNPLRLTFWLNCMAAVPPIDHAAIREFVHRRAAA